MAHNLAWHPPQHLLKLSGQWCRVCWICDALLTCMQLGSLDPATHAYAAWEGFPVEAKMAVGRLFAATPSLHTITIVQRSLRNEVGKGWQRWAS